MLSSTILASSALLLAAVSAAPLPEAAAENNAQPTTLQVLQREDRQRFGDKNAPFIAFEGKGPEWYTVPAAEGTTTLVATKTMTLPDEKKQTAIVGDVIIVQNGSDGSPGVIAEGIGIMNKDGSNGELFNAIACNVQNAEKGLCAMVDYDGTSTKSTDTAVMKQTKSAFEVAGPANSQLANWAAGAITVEVITGGGVQAAAATGSNAAPAPSDAAAIPSSAAAGSHYRYIR